MAAIAWVQSATTFATVTAGTTNTQGYPANNTAGNTLVAQLSCGSGITVSAVTDTAGNTWHRAGAFVGALSGDPSYDLEIWVAFNCKSGANTVNVTYSGTVTVQADLSVHEYSGPILSILGSTGSSGTGTAVTTGSISSTTAVALFFTYIIVDNTVTVNSPWTQRLRSGGGGRLVADVIVSAGGSEAGNATQVTGGTTDWIELVAVLALAGVIEEVPVTPRQPRRLPEPVDATPPTKDTSPFAGAKFGWIQSDVEPRGKGRQPWPEDPLLKTVAVAAALGSLAWVESEVAPHNGRTKQPVEPQGIGGGFVSADVGWIDVETPVPARKRLVPEPELVLDSTKPLPAIGWMPIETDPRGKGRPPLPEDPVLESRLAGLGPVGWVPSEVEPRGRGRAAVPEDPPIDTTKPLLSLGWMEVEVAKRGTGRAAWPEDVTLEPRLTELGPMGWVPSEVEPRGKGRQPWPEDPTLEKTKPLLTLGWVSVDVDPRGRGRAPIPEEPALETRLAELGPMGWVPLDNEWRGKGRPPWPEDVTLEKTTPLATTGWAEVEIAKRGYGRQPWPEDPSIVRTTSPVVLHSIGAWAPDDPLPRRREQRFPDPDPNLTTTKPLPAIGWVPVDADPRGKGRAPIPEEPTLETRLAELGPMGWVTSDVDPRGKGRAPWPEEPALEPRLAELGPMGWASSDVEPRGKGRFVWPEDPTLESLKAPSIPSIAAWAPDDPLPRRREQRPVEPDPLLKTTKPLLTLGWVSVDVEPRGKGRAPWPEDSAVVRPTSSVVLHSIGAWAPDDPLPRARERRFPDPDPNLTATKPLLTIGWASVDVERPRGRVRDLPEEPLLKATSRLLSIGWMDDEARSKARAWRAQPEEPVVGSRAALSSVGWMGVELDAHGRARVAIAEDPTLERRSPVLASIGWVGEEARDPKPARLLVEDPPLETRIVANLGSFAWALNESDYLPPRHPREQPPVDWLLARDIIPAAPLVIPVAVVRQYSPSAVSRRREPSGR